jgi:hypothetical protein
MTARTMLMLLASVAGLAAGLTVSGCSSSPQTAGEGDPTTRAMADPMNYAPSEDQDISGGGLTDFHGDAFKKDMDHVLNP